MMVRLLSLLLCLSLLACANPRLAPVEQAHYRTPGQASARHTVQAGETLYAIAWLYDQDYRDLARYNGLQEPFAIQAGQSIYLSAPSRSSEQASAKPAVNDKPKVVKPRTVKPSVSSPRTKSPSTAARQTKRQSQPTSAAQSRTENKSPARTSRGAPAWQWPTKGNVIQSFAPASGAKGIKIAGKAGQAIIAAADGTVAYSGSGLRGYGQLLIIKHNREYLSAYAHNRKLLVKEGDSVAAGQRIAEMGDSEAAQVMLHFEIRKAGKPEDPLSHLRQTG